MPRHSNVRIPTLLANFSSPLLFTCLAQVVLSQAVLHDHPVGHDTLMTITANESYELGYRLTRSQTEQTCFYSASSGVGLIRLAKEEFKIYNLVNEAFRKVKRLMGSRFEKLIREYLQDYSGTTGVHIKEQTSTSDATNVPKVSEDLIGAYRMVRRFRSYIQKGLREALSSLQAPSSSSWHASEAINTLKPLSNQGPFRRDMHLTMFAIIFTQLQYRWSPQSVSMGTIKGLELGATLRAVHCIELGVHAVASGIYSVGIDWLELATMKIQNGDQSADSNFVLDLLQKANSKHDKLWHPLTFWSLNATFFSKRLNESSVNESRQWQRSFSFDTYEKFEMELDEDQSWDVCTGHLQQTEKQKSRLFCWHETKVHPTWTLGPLKAELLANVPFQLVQFHNVLGSVLIQNIHATCDNEMQTSNLFASQQHFSPKVRLSENCFVQNDQLELLTQRITGLVGAGGEIVPVVSYPPGGHTRLHIDFKYQGGFRERIATFVYFLEGPEIGGEVVFPKAKVAAKPVQGSAILWYNLLKSSELNDGTMHAGCAVVKGQKTIATHLISYDLQPHLTCETDFQAQMQYLNNGKLIYKTTQIPSVL